jgi:hypothetical protein
MVQLTPHDSAVLTRLVRFGRLPIEKRREILGELEGEDARRVGEAVLDSQKYSESSDQVRATVDRVQKWLDQNRRSVRLRPVHRRSGRSR